MKDLQVHLEKLLADADDCDLIANLTTDVSKRVTFRRMAEEFRAMAHTLHSDIDAKAARDK